MRPYEKEREHAVSRLEGNLQCELPDGFERRSRLKEKIIMMLLAGILALGTVSVTACAVQDAEVDSQQAAAVSKEEESEEERMLTENTGNSDSTEEVQNIQADIDAQGANGFSFALLRQMLHQQQAEENFVMSPYSVWLLLAALSDGTQKQVQDELLLALGYSGNELEEFGEMVSRLNRQLMQEERRKAMAQYGENFESPLKIANALFVGENEKVRAGFEQTFTQEYDGGLFTVNFADPAVVNRINDWAAKKTEGKIDRVLESMDPKTVAAIVNAIYYSDTWSSTFDEQLTKPDIFTGVSGRQEVPFMNRRFSENLYFENEQMQATVLHTCNGGHLILMLPKEGYTPQDLQQQMDQQTLDAIWKTENCTVNLSLPRFEIRNESFSVREALKALGIVIVSDTEAYLDGVTEGEPLTVSQAVQKAMIKVDEKGMTAAAVTVMGVMRMSLPRETKTVELKFDRPFAFLVTADTQDFGQQVLFGGVVNRIEQ